MTKRATTTEIRNKVKVHQWQNSNEVSQWFKNIPNKNECVFTIFGFPEFHSSLTEDLLKPAILFAQNPINIPPESIKFIFNFHKAFMYHNDDPLVKQHTSVEPDVTMGSHDNSRVRE